MPRTGPPPRDRLRPTGLWAVWWLALECTCAPAWSAESLTANTGLQIIVPAEATAGQMETVELTIVQPLADSAASLPRVFVNAGSVSPLRETGVGRWSADYTLPEAKYPQVILFAVHDPSHQQLAESRLVLLGAPSVVLQSEPHVSMEVRERENTFGPVVTDGDGHAELRIIVPPGLDEVETIATDSYGNATTGRLPLNLPPFGHLLAVCAADESAVYVVATDPLGLPLVDGDFEIAAPGLHAAPAIQLHPGLFRIALRSESASPNDSEVSVQIEAQGEVQHCSLQQAAPPQPPRPPPPRPPPPRPPPPRTSRPAPSSDPKVRLVVGALVGASSNFGKVLGPLAGARLAYPISQARLGFRIEAEAIYLFSMNSVLDQNNQRLALKLQGVPLAASVRYVFGAGAWEPSAALSVGTTFTHFEAKGLNTHLTVRAHPLLLGGSLGLGRQLPVGTLQVEAGYRYSRLNSSGVAGNLLGAQADIAYGFTL